MDIGDVLREAVHWALDRPGPVAVKDQCLLSGTAQDPIMAYTHEPFGQDVHCKPPDELFVG
tara:strand:+ start:1546 stop:1728 length:183 start_codon:yes stop_codon:yes gene_type:complete